MIHREVNLTVYFEIRPLPDLVAGFRSTHIIANTSETRYMVPVRSGEISATMRVRSINLDNGQLVSN